MMQVVTMFYLQNKMSSISLKKKINTYTKVADEWQNRLSTRLIGFFSCRVGSISATKRRLLLLKYGQFWNF